jgi:hypothetical protein
MIIRSILESMGYKSWVSPRGEVHEMDPSEDHDEYLMGLLSLKKIDREKTAKMGWIRVYADSGDTVFDVWAWDKRTQGRVQDIILQNQGEFSGFSMLVRPLSSSKWYEGGVDEFMSGEGLVPREGR